MEEKYLDSLHDVDLEAMARDELLRLQRQYRVMEGDRRGYALQSGTTISRANRIMTVLQAEKDNLLLDIGNAASKRNQEEDKGNQKQLANLLNRLDEYKVEMKEKIALIKEEEIHVDRITERIVKQQLIMKAIFGQSVTLPELTKRLKVLENRLYHVTTAFDSRCSKNNALRDYINLLLQERGRFHHRHLQLKHQIVIIKTRMLQNVYYATQTYDSRDDDVLKIKTLVERDQKESKQHVLEMKELQRVLHHDEKNHKFLEVKNEKRYLIEDDIDRQRRLEGIKDKATEKVLRSYKKSVREILKLAGIQDVDKLCSAYLDQEQKNFVRFQYITDVNNECEVIREAIHLIKTDIEEASNECDRRQEQQINQSMQNRDEMLHMRSHLQRLYKTLDIATDKIQKVVIGMEEAFMAAECNNSPVIQMLGNYTGLHARNLRLCIEILERTIRDLVREKASLEARKEAEIGGITHTHAHYMGPVHHKQKPEGGPFKPKVMLTGRLNPAEEDDEEEKMLSKRPIYLDEYKAAIIERMAVAGIIGGNADGGDADSEHYASHISILSRGGPSDKSSKEGKQNLPKLPTPASVEVKGGGSGHSGHGTNPA